VHGISTNVNKIINRIAVSKCEASKQIKQTPKMAQKEWQTYKEREAQIHMYVCTIRKLTLYLCVLNTRCEMQKGNNKKRILLSCCCGGCKNVHERATNSRAKAKGAADSSNNNYNVELKWAQLGFGFIDAPRAKKKKNQQQRNRSPHPNSHTLSVAKKNG